MATYATPAAAAPAGVSSSLRGARDLPLRSKPLAAPKRGTRSRRTHPLARASNPRTFGSAPIESARPRRPGPRPHPTLERSAASHGGEAGSANEARRLDPPAPSTIASARTVRTP